MIIEKEEDITKYLGRKLKLERLIKLYNVIKENLPSNKIIRIVEWYYPFYYIEVVDTTNKFEQPDDVRLALSYNIRKGSIMNEVINGKQSDKYHGCMRSGMYKTVKIIKEELNTKFDIPIKT